MADYTLIFDGGSLGNPGTGYGSYRLTRHAEGRQKTIRLDFGPNVTSNVAEYKSLIAGMEDLLAMIQKAGKKPSDFAVSILGDSQLVVEQLNGRWKVKHPNMLPLHAQALALFKQFGKGSSIRWHERENSVRTLGH